MSTVLIVDDRPVERRLLRHALKARHRVLEAGDADSALARLDQGPVDVVLLDLHLPPNPETAEAGIRLRQAIRERQPWLPVVVITGDQEHDLALEMARRGVADYLLKPVDPRVLEVVIERSLSRARLERELGELREQVRDRYSFGNMIGQAPAMRRVFAQLRRLAGAPTTVLLLGESGTGKSALARALHNEGPRAEGPFVVVDGAAIPESLMESELFGHVKGAFTGAETEKTGRLRAAQGGTLFLDEVGNLSAAAQAKLLLFLDTRRCTPVGSGDSVEVDARLVAATNRDLAALVRAGEFREDLLFRLQVATLTLPPLRERSEDVPGLAEHLLARLCRDSGRPRCRLTPAAVKALREHRWPGNVRQLAHVLETSLVLAEGASLDAGDLVLPPGEEPVESPPAAGSGGPAGDAGGGFKERVTAFERRLLREALERTGGNKAAAGRQLGLDENQIRYLCRKHRLG